MLLYLLSYYFPRILQMIHFFWDWIFSVSQQLVSKEVIVKSLYICPSSKSSVLWALHRTLRVYNLVWTSKAMVVRRWLHNAFYCQSPNFASHLGAGWSLDVLAFNPALLPNWATHWWLWHPHTHTHIRALLENPANFHVKPCQGSYSSKDKGDGVSMMYC